MYEEWTYAFLSSLGLNLGEFETPKKSWKYFYEPIIAYVGLSDALTECEVYQATLLLSKFF